MVLSEKEGGQERFISLVDSLNRIYDRDTLFFAVQGIARSLKMRQAMILGRYTTRWDEFVVLT